MTSAPTAQPSLFIQEESPSSEDNSMNSILWSVIGALGGVAFCTCIGLRYYYSHQNPELTMANAKRYLI